MSKREVNAPGAREKFVEWIDRGDAVGVFVNSDLGHHDLGRALFIPLDPEEQARLPVGKARAPDGAHGLGWRYLLESIETNLDVFEFVAE